MKVGDKIKMLVSYYPGLITKEKWFITKITNEYIYLESAYENWQFDRKTGKCLNNDDDIIRTIDLS